MVSARMRPRFELQVSETGTAPFQRLSAALEQPDCPCTGFIKGRHAHLRMSQTERKLWSPHLTLELDNHPPGALLKGHFGPRADIWTFFVAMYAIFGFLGLVALIFGYSQWTLDTPPSALWGLPACLVGAGIVYGLALYGQHKSQTQMKQLHDFVQEAVKSSA